MISARDWNRLMDELARWTPLGYTPADASADWAHPWFTTAAWNGKMRRFEASIRPGLVDGKDVFVTILDGDKGTKDVPLTDDPLIPLPSFRHIGGSTNVTLETAGEAVPEFFEALGVRDSTTITTDDLEASTPTDITQQKLASAEPATAAEQLPERQLKACDIILRCGRARTVVEWIFGSAIENTLAQFKVGTSGAASAPRLRISQSAFSATAAVDPLSKLDGSYIDTGYEETKVCTVYLLSPPDASADAEPDETWTAYAQHDLFWPAKFIVKKPASVATQNLEVNLAGLGNAAGAQINVNQLLAQNNDAFAAASQFLFAREITGRITTPGHRVPPAWDHATSLDPPFPYKGLP